MTLAVITAVSYVLIGFHILAVGDLQTTDRPDAIIYVAAGSYLLGGLLMPGAERSGSNDHAGITATN